MTDKPPTSNPNLATQLAWRAGSEVISGILVGLMFGYGFDYFFATKPWGMVFFIVLGAAAGMRNIIRLVGQDKKTLNSDQREER